MFANPKRLLVLGAALVALVVLGWVAWHLRAGALAEAEAERLAAQLDLHEKAAEDRAAVNAAETERLLNEASDRALLGRLIDEANADADAGARALGVRSVRRLNAIR